VRERPAGPFQGLVPTAPLPPQDGTAPGNEVRRTAQAFGFDAAAGLHYGGTPLQTAAHSLRRTGTQVKGKSDRPATPARR